MSLVDREVNKVWKDGKSRIQNKVDKLVEKYISKETNPAFHRGVKVGDDILEEMETNHHSIEASKAPIYGNIEGITKDQEEILNIPPNHRTFPKLNLENFKTELEKCVIKANWQKQQDWRKHEEHNHRSETDETIKDSNEVQDNKSNIVDFRNLRATDLKNNKRIIIPNVDTEDEEEIRRSNVKKELEGVFC